VYEQFGTSLVASQGAILLREAGLGKKVVGRLRVES
jgi:hypothetical protein